MVEEYLDSISEKDDKKESVVERIDRIIGKYRDRIKIPADGDYKKQVRAWQYEDHMKKRQSKNSQIFLISNNRFSLQLFIFHKGITDDVANVHVTIFNTPIMKRIDNNHLVRKCA
jgi:signal peptidase I